MLTMKPELIVKGCISITKKGPHGIETYKQNNLCTESFRKVFCAGWGTSYAYDQVPMLGIKSNHTTLRVGDGNKQPTEQDTALTKQLWSLNITDGSFTVHEDFKGIQVIMTYVIPATSSYVGTIRELGLVSDNLLITHALLKDAEGNPYEIEKSDLDQITISYAVDVTMLGDFYINGSAWDHGTYGAGLFSYTVTFGNVGLSLASTFFKPIVKNNRYNCPVTSLFSTNTARGDRNTCRIDIPKARMTASSSYNNHYIFSLITSRRDFGINFPNEILPPMFLKNYDVGKGDGITQDFIPPIPMWDENTEEIYIDGQLQIRNIDYTCDHMHNLQKNVELLPLFQATIIKNQNEKNPSNALVCASNDCNRISEAQYIKTYYKKKDTLLETSSDSALVASNEYIIFELPIEMQPFNWNVQDIYIATYRTANIKLEYSDDCETWQEIVSQDITGLSQNPQTQPLSKWTKISLEEPIIKKYWRYVNSNVYGTAGLMFMPPEGKPLHFNVAPPENAVITMNCKTSVPYKDERHVIDIAGIIQV